MVPLVCVVRESPTILLLSYFRGNVLGTSLLRIIFEGFSFFRRYGEGFLAPSRNSYKSSHLFPKVWSWLEVSVLVDFKGWAPYTAAQSLALGCRQPWVI